MFAFTDLAAVCKRSPLSCKVAAHKPPPWTYCAVSSRLSPHLASKELRGENRALRPILNPVLKSGRSVIKSGCAIRRTPPDLYCFSPETNGTHSSSAYSATNSISPQNRSRRLNWPNRLAAICKRSPLSCKVAAHKPPSWTHHAASYHLFPIRISTELRGESQAIRPTPPTALK
jgi:hypothetical protein